MPVLSEKKPRRGKGPSNLVTAFATEPAAAAGVIATSSGAEVYFSDSGGSGPVLFYIYGLACSIAHWKYPLAYFGAAASAAAGRPVHRQVWLDFRGHGLSPALPPGQSLRLSDVVADVQAVCAARGIERATFLGQSLGGTIGLQLAIAAPQLVAALVLLATPPRDPGETLPMQPLSGWLWRGTIALHKRFPQTLRSASRLNQLLAHQPILFTALRELIRRQGFNPGLAKTEDIAEYVQQFLLVEPRLFVAMAGDLAAFDAIREAPQVDCPVLIIAGANDRIVPLADAKRLAQNLSHGELCIVPHGSHCPHFDDPTLVNTVLSEFFNKNSL